jgi:hypothetical protein
MWMAPPVAVFMTSSLMALAGISGTAGCSAARILAWNAP